MTSFDVLACLFLSLAAISYGIYVTRILPKLREYRTIYLRDWGIWPMQILDNVGEYKKICVKEYLPLTWYNAWVVLSVLTMLAFMLMLIF
jgi:hypothetical protein